MFFQKHKTYTLPVEDHQIRRGGNSQIFAADYFGYSLVAKIHLSALVNNETEPLQRSATTGTHGGRSVS